MERTNRIRVMPTILLDGRCAACGRLLMKFAPATEGDVQIKCWASRCKQINNFKIADYSHQTVLATT